MPFYPFGQNSVTQIFQTTASRADYAVTASAASVALSALSAISGSQGPIGPDGACNYLNNGPAGISRAGDDNYKGPQGPSGSVIGPLEP